MKKQLLILGMLLLNLPTSFASIHKVNFNVNTFNEAKQQSADTNTHLKFTVYSKKPFFGVSDVPGFVKKFNAQGELNEKTKSFKNLVVNFKGLNLDTDSSGRDEKLHEYVLGIDKDNAAFNNISVKVMSEEIIIGAPAKEVMATIIIRGKEKKIPLMLEIKNINGDYLAQGKSTASVKELELPDPSIIIAKLLDNIDIEFSFKVQ
jgi:hypothetical protein